MLKVLVTSVAFCSRASPRTANHNSEMAPLKGSSSTRGAGADVIVVDEAASPNTNEDQPTLEKMFQKTKRAVEPKAPAKTQKRAKRAPPTKALAPLPGAQAQPAATPPASEQLDVNVDAQSASVMSKD